MPIPPKKRRKKGTGTVAPTFPVFTIKYITARGPIALATSFAPCAKAT
jgi:hypothetical protein